jgi:hypothetical protein
LGGARTAIAERVHALITQQREQYNWQFIFLGANIDAVHVGSRIGVPQAMAMTYNADDDDAVHATYASAGRAMFRGRAGRAMDFTEDERRQARGGSKKNTKKKN